jgi:ATP-binding cassette subfamily F protein uup
MGLLVSVSHLGKTMGSKQLFDDLSFGIEDHHRIGLLGANGAGKSTLLKILAGLEAPDQGEVAKTKTCKIAYVPQEETFPVNQTALDHTLQCLQKASFPELEAQVQAATHLNIVGFDDPEQKISALSGGWKKRLSLAIAFAQNPDLLILDEPTNHMDWDGILWLEGWLKTFAKAFIIVSHDRIFLNTLCNRTIEISRLYKDGYLALDCAYTKFMERKAEYIVTQQNLQQSMSNKARREVEWLRAGVKARTTKSRSRINEAHQLLDDLAQIKARNLSAKTKVKLEINSGGRLSKKLIELKKVTVAFGEKFLVQDLDLLLGPKSCLGVLGDNGSGKTSLLKVIAGHATNFSGDLYIADGLRLVYFDQKREALPQEQNLMQFLGESSDHVIFKGQSIHVAAYASRFLFDSEKMQLKIAQLSGGEQARLLIAKLLLQPADVLILDEPTNDLDIESIEVLEDSLTQFDGLVILVSHDRSFLENLCQCFLALEGQGDWELYPDLKQWLKQRQKGKAETKTSLQERTQARKQPISRKLSYKEKCALETIESDVEQAEAELSAAQAALTDPDNYPDYQKMRASSERVEKAQAKVDALYKLWADLTP